MGKRIIKKATIILALLFFITPIYFIFASNLTYVSDTLSISASATSSNHIIQFTATNAVPPLGKIVYVPEGGDFTIPAGLDYEDVDFLYATTTDNYINREVGTTTTETVDGVSVTTGTSGSITITLNSATGIGAGDQIRILVGTNAIYGVAGTVQITNPTATTSYGITLTTRDASNVLIDEGITAIAIVDQVSVLPIDTTETDPPLRTNGAPDGEIAFGTETVEISLNTDEFAICRYSETAGVDYNDMGSQFPTTGLITHAGLIVTGLVAETTYNYYVRCIDDEGNKNIDDFIISFFWAVAGPGGGGGGGIVPSGTASVTFSGIAFPMSTLVVLQDGVITRQITLGSEGIFNTKISNIPQGTYTFGIYAIDADNIKSSTFNSTFSLVEGIDKTLSDIFISPTLVLDTERVEPGGVVGISGTAIKNSTVEIWTHQQKFPLFDFDITKITASVGVDGRWSSVIDTTGFFIDTYQVKAKAVLRSGDESFFSDYQYYGVGVDPNPINFLTADLNRDGFVNLIDFSILLFHWATDGGDADPPPDINRDGDVNLIDFSIMLFQWTG